MSTTPEQKQQELGTSSSGMEPNLAAALSYVLSIITGVIFFVIEKENKYVRFHAMQAILFGAAWIVLWIVLGIVSLGLIFVPIIGWIINAVIYLGLGLGGFILWLLLIYKAYQGERFKLPIIGDIAEKNA
ncbi:MAG: DUF4870 domain-containing protein [Nitrospirae bacterium]|nr:DUF4870 domain-containing protein [Nitrospirota bacterium]